MAKVFKKLAHYALTISTFTGEWLVMKPSVIKVSNSSLKELNGLLLLTDLTSTHKHNSISKINVKSTLINKSKSKLVLIKKLKNWSNWGSLEIEELENWIAFYNRCPSRNKRRKLKAQETITLQRHDATTICLSSWCGINLNWKSVLKTSASNTILAVIWKLMTVTHSATRS